MTNTMTESPGQDALESPQNLPPVEIIGYRTFWNATDNHGQIWILFADETGKLFDTETPEEMMMLVDLLRNEKPIYYDIQHNFIMTGLEPVGEGEVDTST